MKIFAKISKVDTNDDGTITVSGIASTESVDSEGEIIKSDAMQAAIPDFMKYGTGNLREMHQNLAAGTVDKAEIVGTETHISATVVDPIAIKKVTTGVYKGFSIGGKVTGRDPLNKSTITGVKLVEISLVDRPANPDSVIQLWKSETLDEEPTAPNKGPEFEQVWRSARDGSIHLKKADLVAHHEAMDAEKALADVAGGVMGKLGAMLADNAAKAETTTEAQAEPAKRDRTAPLAALAKLPGTWLAKGASLYSIANMAQLLASVKDAEESFESASYWGSAVDVPDDLKNRFGALCVEFGDIIAQTLAALLAAMSDEESAEAMSRAEIAIDLMKAGARNSKSDMAKLQAAHDALTGMGAKCAAAAKHEHGDDLHKVESDRDLYKAAFDRVSAEIDKLVPRFEEMQKRIKDLESAPMPPKTAGVLAISKEFDTTGKEPEPVMTKAQLDAELEKLSPEDRVLALIKIAKINGQPVLRS
jgi:hypothetical protein